MQPFDMDSFCVFYLPLSNDADKECKDGNGGGKSANQQTGVKSSETPFFNGYFRTTWARKCEF